MSNSSAMNDKGNGHDARPGDFLASTPDALSHGSPLTRATLEGLSKVMLACAAEEDHGAIIFSTSLLCFQDPVLENHYDLRCSGHGREGP
jgi:hypothetical protein